jgi:hypothetical protein
MIEIHTIADLELLRESVNLECKLAAGRDGKGALPEDFWPTYSAFANTGASCAPSGSGKPACLPATPPRPAAKASATRSTWSKLQYLTQVGMLESTGVRGAVYHLPGESIPTPDDVFDPPARISAPSSPNLDGSSPNLGEHRDVDGRLITEQLELPVIYELVAFSPRLRATLRQINPMIPEEARATIRQFRIVPYERRLHP